MPCSVSWAVLVKAAATEVGAAAGGGVAGAAAGMKELPLEGSLNREVAS